MTRWYSVTGTHGLPGSSPIAHYESLKLADGSRFYAVLKYDDRHGWLTLFHAGPGGNILWIRTVSNPPIDPATAIEQATELPDGRISILLHIDPTCDAEVIVNPRIASEISTKLVTPSLMP